MKLPRVLRLVGISGFLKGITEVIQQRCFMQNQYARVVHINLNVLSGAYRKKLTASGAV